MTTRILALILLAAACKDDIHALDAPPAPIDSPSTDGSMTDGAVSPSLAVAAEGNGTLGTLDSVGTVSHSTTEGIAPGSVEGDPMARVDTTNGFLYIVNRSVGENVSQLDTATLTLQLQVSTGSGTDPQDIAAIGTKWYVATFQGSGLEVADSGSGSATTFTNIDLGSAVNAATHKCDAVFAVGTNVFVACGLLNTNFLPTGNGLVLVVDSTTDTVTSSFSLTHPNPINPFELLPDGNLAITTVDFTTGSGCLEEVTTTGTPASAGCLFQNSALGSGNYVDRLAVTADMKTLMLDVESITTLAGAIVPYDIASSTLGSAISPASEQIGDVATCPDGTVVGADNGSGSNGLRFYSKTAERTTAPINIGIAPGASHGLVCY